MSTFEQLYTILGYLGNAGFPQLPGNFKMFGFYIPSLEKSWNSNTMCFKMGKNLGMLCKICNYTLIPAEKNSAEAPVQHQSFDMQNGNSGLENG